MAVVQKSKSMLWCRSIGSRASWLKRQAMADRREDESLKEGSAAAKSEEATGEEAETRKAPSDFDVIPPREDDYDVLRPCRPSETPPSEQEEENEDFQRNDDDDDDDDVVPPPKADPNNETTPSHGHT